MILSSLRKIFKATHLYSKIPFTSQENSKNCGRKRNKIF